MLYKAFQLVRHLQKCPFPWWHLKSHVIHVPCIHPTQHSKLHLDQFSRFHGRESLYFTICVRMGLMRN